MSVTPHSGVLCRLKCSKGWTALVLTFAVFTDSFVFGTVMPVLPIRLSDTFHLSNRSAQLWIGVLAAAYGITIVISSYLGGASADTMSTRRFPFLMGLASLVMSVLAFVFARNAWVLLLGRLAQGVSSGLVWTVAFAILQDRCGDREAGQWVGYVTWGVLGAVVGALTGGYIEVNINYEAIFIPIVPLIVLDLCLRQTLDYNANPVTPICTHIQPWTAESVDVHNSNTEATVSTLKPQIEEQEPELQHLLGPNLQQHKTSRSIDNAATSNIIQLFMSIPMLAASVACFLNTFLGAGLASVISEFLWQNRHWSSRDIAVVAACLYLPLLISPFCGYVGDRFGSYRVVFVGFLLASGGLFLLSFETQEQNDSKITVFVLLTVIGIALPMLFTPAVGDVFRYVTAEEASHPGRYGDKGPYGRCYGLLNIITAIGTATGPLFCAALTDMAGIDILCLTVASACLILAFPTAYGLSRNANTDLAV